VDEAISYIMKAGELADAAAQEAAEVAAEDVESTSAKARRLGSDGS
jgi:hypothetical protein